MKRASQQQMESAVACFRSSGLTQREFCQRENIKLPTFTHRYRKVNGSAGTPVGGFTQVTAPLYSIGLEVVFPNGLIIGGIQELTLIH